MRLIDADALEKDYRSQFESVYRNIRDAVNISDYYIERKAAYDKELARMEMESFCEFLQSRPTIEAEPVRHRTWVIKTHDDGYGEFEIKHCPDCDRGLPTEYDATYCPNCGAKMDGKESK